VTCATPCDVHVNKLHCCHHQWVLQRHQYRLWWVALPLMGLLLQAASHSSDPLMSTTSGWLWPALDANFQATHNESGCRLEKSCSSRASKLRQRMNRTQGHSRQVHRLVAWRPWPCHLWDRWALCLAWGP
jgi:hypothetical protein